MNDLNLDFMKNIRNIYVNHFSLYNMYAMLCKYIYVVSMYDCMYACWFVTRKIIFISIYRRCLRFFVFRFLSFYCNMKCDDWWLIIRLIIQKNIHINPFISFTSICNCVCESVNMKSFRYMSANSQSLWGHTISFSFIPSNMIWRNMIGYEGYAGAECKSNWKTEF